jgi:hypothetical protein
MRFGILQQNGVLVCAIVLFEDFEKDSNYEEPSSEYENDHNLEPVSLHPPPPLSPSLSPSPSLVSP